MEGPRVLFVSSEIYPYLPESPISNVCQQLPAAIQDKGFEIRTFMPKFGCVNERRNQLHEVIRLSGLNLIINDADHPLIIKVASISAARMQIYFIDNEDYFQRKTLYKDEEGEWFPDNDERSIFFARGVLETVRKLRWSPDIVHCHGWFSFLLALYMRRSFKDDPLYADSRIILSLYDEPTPEAFDENFKYKAMNDGVKNKDLETMNEPTFENMVKMCISHADGIIVAEPDSNEKYIEYALENKKHILEYQSPEEYIDKYADFYRLVAKRRKKNKDITPNGK
ncbi:MAG: glycogen/starch synthase [Prevotellaceae bacterium]|jgi:starch synthase|nr:glycogen/starch synthase [Prevotellaceae bacterium]